MLECICKNYILNVLLKESKLNTKYVLNLKMVIGEAHLNILFTFYLFS